MSRELSGQKKKFVSRRRHTWYYFNSHFSFRLHFHWTSFQNIHQKLLQPACRAGSNFPAVGVGSGVCTGPCMAWHKQEDERATSMGGLQVLNRTPGSSRGDCCPLSVPWQQPGHKSSGPCQDRLLRVTGVFPSSLGKCWLQEAFCMELMGHRATKPHHIAPSALDTADNRNAEIFQERAMHEVNYQLFVLHSIMV